MSCALLGLHGQHLTPPRSAFMLPDMNSGPDMSLRQTKSVEKIKRLREYFREDSPEIYEWTPSDETLDFATMSDDDVAEYLKRSSSTDPAS